MLGGVVSMPSNIFATTGTNVSILFIDATNDGDVILIDASNLGEKIKEGKNQKTLLSVDEEQQIIETFNDKKAVEDFSVVVSYDEIEAKNYSFSAGQYFDVKVEHVELTAKQFEKELSQRTERLNLLFSESRDLEKQVAKHLARLAHD
jgi:type I restriction enzyme M protein